MEDVRDSFFVRNARKITWVAIFGVVVCIILIVFFSVKKYLDKKTYLTVQFAPSNAVLEINGIDGEFRNGTYEIAPGAYGGTLKADGFESKDVVLDIKGHQVNSLADYLVNKHNGMKYFEKSASDISILRAIKDDENVAKFLEEYDHKASVYDALPLDASYYRPLVEGEDAAYFKLIIKKGTDSPECKGTLCLLASGRERNDGRMGEILAENGYNIEDYEVYYERSW